MDSPSPCCTVKKTNSRERTQIEKKKEKKRNEVRITFRENVAKNKSYVKFCEIWYRLYQKTLMEECYS